MMRAVRVLVADPSAYTPPYDHALCAALARGGAEVELATSPFTHGEAPAPAGYRRRERFYRLSPRGPLRVATKLAQHVPDMLALRRAARAFDVVHFQWLSVQHVDAHLLPRERPVVLTAHDVLPREPRAGQLAAQRRLYERVDAVVVHSEHGRRRLAEMGVEAIVIPHGAFVPVPPTRLPRELPHAEVPIVLFFGLLRPYKGLDVLLDAWRDMGDAELWVVGSPRMPLPATLPENVRLVPRFVGEGEVSALLERADLVVLPYREIDQSGVLFSALGAGRPLLLSDAGGFPEIEAAAHVPAGDVAALGDALRRLIGDPDERDRLAAAARAAAATTYGWDAIARRHLDLYATLAAR